MWIFTSKYLNALNFELVICRERNFFEKNAWVVFEKLRLLLLVMKTAAEWALLSPEGTFHKLSEPNFFVGREDQMDLILKVR